MTVHYSSHAALRHSPYPLVGLGPCSLCYPNGRLQTMTTTKGKVTNDAGAVIEHTAETTTKGFEKTLEAMKENIAKATKGLETSHLKFKEGVEKAVKTSEELLSFSQGNLEAVIKASQIYTSGFQGISKQI